MVKPNYQFEKRQKELEKKKKQEQKRLRKLAENQPAGEAATEATDAISPSDGADNTSTS